MNAVVLADERWGRLELDVYRSVVEAALDDMAERRIIARIWAHDYTVWKPEPSEITNRLGWLHIVEEMADKVDAMLDLVNSVHAAGYTEALLLGMGGSSLAPELFSRVFWDYQEALGSSRVRLHLAVLDSIVPGAVLAQAERLDPARTLFIVSTKSGTTVETLSLFKFFYHWLAEQLGTERAGEHFVAITDPGSSLANLAERYRFRATFLNNPHLGGRYSALSYFGLVPAALVGVDLTRLLDQALGAVRACGPEVAVRDNPAAWLGATLGELARVGRDKVTFCTPSRLTSLGDWIEQLIAESTGKEGKGILPVVGEPLGPPEVYGPDRLFVFLGNDECRMSALNGHPVIQLPLDDPYELGAQFFLWEMATAVAGYRLGINPFDQPDVEAAKALARRAIAAYQENGVLPADEPAPLTAETLSRFLAQARPGDPVTGAGRSYIAIHAYLQPTPETDAALLAFRLRLRDRYRLATTVGYGPRFLHSTGQLHKGDAGHGLFIQITADDPRDIRIPDDGGTLTFGVLKRAQALGDRQALVAAGRQVIHFHLGEQGVAELTQVAEELV